MSFPSTRLMPTSITTASRFTISAVTKRGLPIAATRISASRATSASLRVFEWPVVIVAIQLLDLRQELPLAHRDIEDQLSAAQTELVCFSRFVANIKLRGGIVPHANGDETRLVRELRQRVTHFRFNLLRDCFAVDELRGHRALVPHVAPPLQAARAG